MWTLTELKIYSANITSFAIACCDWLEPTLKVMLLVLTIGYTAHKWWNLKKNK